MEGKWSQLGCLPTEPTACFLRGIKVWLHKPHVINRNLCGTKILTEKCIPYCGKHTIQTLVDIIKECLKTDCSDSLETEMDIEAQVERIWSLLGDFIGGATNMLPEGGEKELDVIIRDLLPRQLARQDTVREVVILDKQHQVALFYPLCTVQENGYSRENMSRQTEYLISLQNNSLSVSVTVVERSASRGSSCSGKWLLEQLLPKIVKWSETEEGGPSASSLRLVPIDRYNALYQQMKVKYGAPMVEVWPESTDPQKFVYEDVAIAAYLLLLWEAEREEKGLEKKQSFVDLGCGNGLLVHLLASEGHRGVGLDVRRRKIWDIYGPHVDLQERSITPSDASLFPDYDWLIGNHSDELTPWIPVMAARSGYSSRYFVLPCCHHDFDSKFSRKLPGSSQYRTYLDYIRSVGEVCGFTVEEDTLRIPSTKRVCFIGRNRKYSPSEEKEMDSKRTSFINSRCKAQTRASKPLQNLHQSGLSHQTTDQSEEGSSTEGKTGLTENNFASNKNSLSEQSNCRDEMWAVNFAARSNVEVTRNCAHVEKSVRDRITGEVFKAVLATEDGTTKTLSDGRRWRTGGALALPDAAAMFDKETLHLLKRECGGLQTLLKNSHYIFHVYGGHIHIRDWSVEPVSRHKGKRQKTSSSSQQFYKTKPCWLHKNHPDGCPVSQSICTFAHGDLDVHEIVNKVT